MTKARMLSNDEILSDDLVEAIRISSTGGKPAKVQALLIPGDSGDKPILAVWSYGLGANVVDNAEAYFPRVLGLLNLSPRDVIMIGMNLSHLNDVGLRSTDDILLRSVIDPDTFQPQPMSQSLKDRLYAELE